VLAAQFFGVLALLGNRLFIDVDSEAWFGWQLDVSVDDLQVLGQLSRSKPLVDLLLYQKIRDDGIDV
jgi:hypothetical protein